MHRSLPRGGRQHLPAEWQRWGAESAPILCHPDLAADVADLAAEVADLAVEVALRECDVRDAHAALEASPHCPPFVQTPHAVA